MVFSFFPGGHRKRPLKKTGCVEYWTGFSGKVADMIMNEINN